MHVCCIRTTIAIRMHASRSRLAQKFFSLATDSLLLWLNTPAMKRHPAFNDILASAAGPPLCACRVSATETISMGLDSPLIHMKIAANELKHTGDFHPDSRNVRYFTTAFRSISVKAPRR